MDMKEFLQNRRQFPLDQLAKYAGKHVAWSPDGASIVASDEDLAKVIAAVQVLGFDPAECVVSCVPSSDAIVGGGGLAGVGP